MTAPLLYSSFAYPAGAGSDTLAADTSRTPGQGTASAAVSVTCAAGTLLLAAITWDSAVSTLLTAAASGGGLSWAARATAAVNSASVGGGAAVATAYSAAGLSAQTITGTVTGALATTLTIITFTGADPVQDGQTATLSNTAAGLFATTITSRRHLSWTWSACYNWDGATQGTQGPNQSAAVTYTDNVGDAGWVQRHNATTVGTGQAVTSNTLAPSVHGHMASVEILPVLLPAPPRLVPTRMWQPVARSAYL